ncbi:MAG: amidohydrolase [Myxococcota bacterium]
MCHHRRRHRRSDSITKIFLWASAAILIACVSPIRDEGDAGTPPYTLYKGGDILTMEGDTAKYAEVLVRQGNRIVYVGHHAGVEQSIIESATVVDLNGRALLPGFIDSHIHFSQAAQIELLHRIQPWDFENADAFIAYVKELASETPIGEPIFIFGYDRALIEPHVNLTRGDLDKATTSHPVYVLYLGMHWGSANSLALERAGITKKTPTHTPGGGIYFKDEDGEPTGLATETAIFFIAHAIEESIGADEQRLSMYRIAERLSANGITLATDLATGASTGPGDVSLLRSLAHDENFAVRLSATPLYQILPDLEQPIPWDGFFQANRIKLLIDASLVGGTSATQSPQLDGSTGNLNYTRAAYRQALHEAIDKGFSTTTHTMGDRGHQLMLDVFDELDLSGIPIKGSNHSIEHSALVTEEDASRMARLGLSSSLLMPLLYVYGDAMRDTVYGPEMASQLFPAARLKKSGVNVALHSDAPIFPTQPLLYAWVAVNRLTTSDAVLGADQAISPFAALQGITINAARHLGLEQEVGSLAAGKLADLVILEENPLKVDPKAMKDIAVIETIKGGLTTFLLKDQIQ